MQQPHDIRKLIQIISQLGRTTTERIVIDSAQVDDGEIVDHEVRCVIRDGVVEIQETSYKRRVDCGHITTAGSIAASCDLCGRKVCPDCYSYCAKCGSCVCRYCFRIYIHEDSEETLCTPCHMDTKRKDAVIGTSKAIYRFFINRKE